MTSKVYVALRVQATPERAFQVFVGEIASGGGQVHCSRPPRARLDTSPSSPGRAGV